MGTTVAAEFAARTEKREMGPSEEEDPRFCWGRLKFDSGKVRFGGVKARFCWEELGGIGGDCGWGGRCDDIVHSICWEELIGGLRICHRP
jgi:hypothetical protein